MAPVHILQNTSPQIHNGRVMYHKSKCFIAENPILPKEKHYHSPSCVHFTNKTFSGPQPVLLDEKGIKCPVQAVVMMHKPFVHGERSEHVKRQIWKSYKGLNIFKH